MSSDNGNVFYGVLLAMVIVAIVFIMAILPPAPDYTGMQYEGLSQRVRTLCQMVYREDDNMEVCNGVVTRVIQNHYNRVLECSISVGTNDPAFADCMRGFMP